MTTKLFDPKAVGTNYEPDLTKYQELGKKAGAKPFSTDKKRTMLVIVDGQRDFVHKDGTLSVPGAVPDMQRLADFMYTNVGNLTAITASMDSHFGERMIFLGDWWKDMETGGHPDPYTPIYSKEIVAGRWLALVDPVWSIKYVDQLEKNGQLNHRIWPKHCVVGTDGQRLVPAIEEAIAYHSAARKTTPSYITKGTNRRVEHFGIFGAQVPDPSDPSTQLNTAMLDIIASYDRIYVAGEAKSHCVLKTMQQMLTYFSNQPDVISKIRFMMDCTSSVVSPDVDFELLANAELKDMESKGVVLVNSTDPIK